MPSITREYWPFYLEGRGAQRIRKRDFDVEAVAQEIVAKGTPVRDAVLAASQEVYKPHSGERAKRKWLAETGLGLAADALRGLDGDLAFAAHTQGLIDELAYAMEPDVIGAMEEEMGDVEEDGEEDDGEEEDEDDDDDEL